MNYKMLGYGNKCKKSICKNHIKRSTMSNSSKRCYNKCKNKQDIQLQKAN